MNLIDRAKKILGEHFDDSHLELKKRGWKFSHKELSSDDHTKLSVYSHENYPGHNILLEPEGDWHHDTGEGGSYYDGGRYHRLGHYLDTTKNLHNKKESVELDESFNKILGVVGKSKEGVAYMIHKTIQGINSGVHPDKAFRDAAEDENYYGQRPDIVKDRKLAIDTLHKFGHKVSDFTEGIPDTPPDIDSESKRIRDEWKSYSKLDKDQLRKHVQLTSKVDLGSLKDMSKFDMIHYVMHHKHGEKRMQKAFKSYSESLDLSEDHNHEDIASNPPKFVPTHHHEIWKGLVLRSKHTSYGAAVNHYKRHMFKHGSYAATKLAKISAGQSMTAEALVTNPNVSDPSDKLNHSTKITTAGLLGAKIRRYKKFGATHSAFANGAKSHNVSSRLSSS